MAESAAQIDNITRAVAGLDSKLNSVLPKIGQLINPASGNTSGSANILSNALGQFSNPISGAMAGSVFGPWGAAAGAVIGGVAGGVSSVANFAMAAMPDVTSVLNRDQMLYRSSVFSPSAGANYKQVGASISRAMAGGITSVGADAAGAQYMASRGIQFSTNANSMFQSYARSAANSAKLLGMDNATSFQALADLTSGQGSSNLSSTFGIYTSDARTGKSKSEDQIFNEMWGVLTGGRTDITAQDISDSFYKGNLGVSLANAGLSDAQQQRFLAWAYAKAGGKRLDLSSNKSTQSMLNANKAIGNENPIQSTLSINSTMTSTMQTASGLYESGMDRAAQLYKDLNPQIEALTKRFAELNAAIGGFSATPTGTAITQNPGGALLTALTNGKLGDTIGAANKFDLFGMIGKVLGIGGESSGNGTGTSSGAGGGSTMMAPAAGPITATFGQKGKMWKHGGHLGMDYGVPEGSPVHAAAAGTVIKDNNSGELGHYLVVDHGNGITTTYAHLQSSSADSHIGDSVAAGQLIGRSGATGNVTGPHLHFAVQQNGQYIDPRTFLSGGVQISPSAAGNAGSNKTAKSTASYSVSGATLDNAFTTSASGVSGSLYSASQALGMMADSATAAASSWSGNSQAATVGTASGATTGVGGTSSGIGLGSTSGALLGAAGGTKIEINVKIDQANEAEAKKFAQYVKTILEQENLVSNMGRR